MILLYIGYIRILNLSGFNPFPEEFLRLDFQDFDMLSFDFSSPAAWNEFLNARGSNVNFEAVQIDGLTIKLAGNLSTIVDLILYDLRITGVGFPVLASIQQIQLQDNYLPELEFENLKTTDTLTRLELQNNQIDGIDVTGFSNLTWLNVSGNLLQGTLRIAGCIKLQSLFCVQNAITNIAGLDECDQLVTLECNNNHLVQLDISANLNLITLRTENNFLTSLDLTSNTLLSTVIAYNNQIVDLIALANVNITTASIFAFQGNAIDIGYIAEFINYIFASGVYPLSTQFMGGTNGDISSDSALVDKYLIINAPIKILFCNPYD